MKTWILTTLLFCGHLHAMPLMGGNSGGGGMLSPPEPMDESELADFIKFKVPELARMYFNFVHTPYLNPDQTVLRWVVFEGDAPDGSEALNRSTYHKMFVDRPTVLDKMETTSIQVQSEPCFDPVSKGPKDASADADKNELCFNVKDLLKNTPARSLRSHVLALAIHEYSHLKKTTEPEAEFIEHWAKLTVAVDGVIFSRVENEWIAVKHEWETLATVRTLADEVSTLSAVALAFRVSEIAAQIETRVVRVYDLIGYSGLSGWDLDQRAKSLVLALKAQNLATFKCSLPEIQAAPARQGCEGEPGAPDREQISFAELASLNRFTLVVPLADVLRKVKTGNRAALKAELDDVAQLIRALFKDVPAGEHK